MKNTQKSIENQSYRTCPQCGYNINEKETYCSKCNLNINKYDIERLVMLIILITIAFIAIFFKFIR